MLVSESPDFVNLPDPIAALFTAASEKSFFSQSAWYALLTQHARETGTTVRLYTDSNVPAAALVVRTDGKRRLHGLTNAYALEHGPIARPGREGCAATRHLIENVVRAQSNLETIRFTALDPDDPFFTALRQGLRAAGWMVRPFFDSGTWFLDTDRVKFDQYFEERPPILKNTYRRKSKAARGLEYFFSDDGAELESLIADYETIYKQSWKPPERFPTLVPTLIRAASALRALRMGVIRVDGVPAAAQFWLLWRGRAVIYKLAYDEHFARMSLGTLLTMRMVERVLEQDHPSEINFGRGDDPYKKLWLPQRRERWGLLATNPRTWRGLVGGARGLAGRMRDWVLSKPSPQMGRSRASSREENFENDDPTLRITNDAGV